MRKMKSRRLALYALVIALLATTVAYAVLQTTLNISGTVTKKGGSWNIHFENIANVTKSGDATMVTPTISANTTTNFTATLFKPNDAVSFTVDVKNDGTVDAILDSLVLSGVTEAKAKDITYTVTYGDGTAIAKNDKLVSGAKRTIKIIVSYDNVASLAATDQTLNLGLTLVYVQTDKTIQGGSGEGLAYDKPCTVTPITGSESLAPGTEITCGDEYFSVLSTDATSITMLAYYNLNTTTLKQALAPNKIAFSTNYYWEDQTSIDLNTYVPADATLIKDTDAIQVAKRYATTTIGNSATGRLMTFLEAYNCLDSNGGYACTCPSSSNDAYWLGESPITYMEQDVKNYIYFVTHDFANSGSTPFASYNSSAYVRPVVTILKSDVEI